MALLLVTGVLSFYSCKSTPKDVEQNESEEVQIDTSENSILVEDEDL